MLYLRGDISDIHMFLQRIKLIQKSNEELRAANEAFKKITVSTSVSVGVLVRGESVLPKL